MSLTVAITLLRGINVGGRHKISMESLRLMYADLGFPDAKTYIQSGNVVVRIRKPDLANFAGKVESTIERVVGFRPKVIVRTISEMRKVIAGNPFASRREIESNKLQVMFLDRHPSAGRRKLIHEIKSDPEEMHFAGREAYIYFPKGMGQSKLPLAAIERSLNVAWTGRNWNTFTKLLEIAEAMKDAG